LTAGTLPTPCPRARDPAWLLGIQPDLRTKTPYPPPFFEIRIQAVPVGQGAGECCRLARHYYVSIPRAVIGQTNAHGASVRRHKGPELRAGGKRRVATQLPPTLQHRMVARDAARHTDQASDHRWSSLVPTSPFGSSEILQPSGRRGGGSGGGSRRCNPSIPRLQRFTAKRGLVYAGRGTFRPRACALQTRAAR
jgi:hypothetical protein